MGKKMMWMVLGMIAGLIEVSSLAFAWPVPDTGQTGCYNAAGTSITCPEPGQPFAGQDGSYLINPPSYTKLDETGNALPDPATSWVMVRDNVTGLIWEVKTDDGTVHDKDNQYSWYDPNPETNGGNPGTAGAGTDTKDFVDALNDANFGGHSDWRIPNRKEIRSIVIYGWRNPAINTNFFPNDRSWAYWTSDTVANGSTYAWHINTSTGDYSDDYGKSNRYYVRAVRGGQ